MKKWLAFLKVFLQPSQRFQFTKQTTIFPMVEKALHHSDLDKLHSFRIDLKGFAKASQFSEVNYQVGDKG